MIGMLAVEKTFEFKDNSLYLCTRKGLYQIVKNFLEIHWRINWITCEPKNLGIGLSSQSERHSTEPCFSVHLLCKVYSCMSTVDGLKSRVAPRIRDQVRGQAWQSRTKHAPCASPPSTSYTAWYTTLTASCTGPSCLIRRPLTPLFPLYLHLSVSLSLSRSYLS